MQRVERTFRDAQGAIVIQSRLGRATTRKGFENDLFPGIEVGLPGWHRAHSQGPGTGNESPLAIRYAPAEVNLAFQNRGIERFLRRLVAEVPDGVELWLTTATRSHPGTLRLAEIQYRVDAVRDGHQRRLFEASIEIENQRDRPRVAIEATPFAAYFG